MLCFVREEREDNLSRRRRLTGDNRSSSSRYTTARSFGVSSDSCWNENLLFVRESLLRVKTKDFNKKTERSTQIFRWNVVLNAERIILKKVGDLLSHQILFFFVRSSPKTSNITEHLNTVWTSTFRVYFMFDRDYYYFQYFFSIYNKISDRRSSCSSLFLHKNVIRMRLKGTNVRPTRACVYNVSVLGYYGSLWCDFFHSVLLIWLTRRWRTFPRTILICSIIPYSRTQTWRKNTQHRRNFIKSSPVNEREFY